MQTVLGANGQIAEELTRELYKNYTRDIRLVSRHPRKVHESDQLMAANLLDADAADRAVEGSDIAYFTVGLPMDAKLWEEQFPIMMKNVIDACKKHHCKLVFFDNTYMYPKTAEPQTEEAPFVPVGRKATVRANIATLLLDEMNAGRIKAVICRAPEFYGPGKTQSLTNTAIFDAIKHGKKARVPISDKTLRTLIWTPDASRAMALIGNTPDVYDQTWHLPCDDNRLTYKSLIAAASQIKGRDLPYTVVPLVMFKIGGVFNPQLREAQELLSRYARNNIFVSTKFTKRFPEFRITTYRDGIAQLLRPH
ncbi:NAD-dependent epimerase/dehydratase family protein [Candidatus Mycosynbacter amalyticus]|uniref:NAD-dependent epimerase/dehydratase family protein n=1 Tax=Candidatus Mycosynbacter amalyticus TaxID=2665156 RepID=A0A857MIC6_9BACT|nr:NAD-dependent epimerase/dehydratase family protein [Candidatus Mycosynbacter amalyticus]QHN42303.1 NAD-dependent epimerase/dehydratase family protein [Candidatus Mycosynbacter amalyticus]